MRGGRDAYCPDAPSIRLDYVGLLALNVCQGSCEDHQPRCANAAGWFIEFVRDL